jgi:hypothetical protein
MDEIKWTKTQRAMLDRLIKKCHDVAKLAKEVEDEQYEGLVREGKWPKGLGRLGDDTLPEGFKEAEREWEKNRED